MQTCSAWGQTALCCSAQQHQAGPVQAVMQGARCLCPYETVVQSIGWFDLCSISALMCRSSTQMQKAG